MRTSTTRGRARSQGTHWWAFCTTHKACFDTAAPGAICCGVRAGEGADLTLRVSWDLYGPCAQASFDEAVERHSLDVWDEVRDPRL